MEGTGTAWYDEPATVDALARETAEYLKSLHGVGHRFAASRHPRELGRRMILALCQADAPGFQNPQAQMGMQAWWSDVTLDDAEDRSRAVRLARVVAEAWDAATNRPAPLNRHRVCTLYADRYRINRLYARLVRRFETHPPISWLPVIPDHDDAYITMHDARWPRSASVKFLTAFLGADEQVIRQFVGKTRRRR